MSYSINITRTPKTTGVEAPVVSSSEFLQRANETSFEILPGIIESLQVVDDSVFAIIKKNHSSRINDKGDQIDHGDGYFNGTDRTPLDDITLAELCIPTNIDASNNNLKRYIGKRCKVSVKNNIAVYAEVDYGFYSLTTFPIHVIRKIRQALSSKSDSIFSEEGKVLFRQEGYTDEEIQQLSDFKFVESTVGKVNTFAGEGLWFKDTANKDPSENILKANPLVLGLNKLGMKTKNCHKPTRLFSGK